jgi:hypothetical protein
MRGFDMTSSTPSLLFSILNYFMKDHQIKVWPETIHYLSSISSFHLPSGRNNIRIDFSAADYASSTGLTVLLLRLLKLLNSDNNTRKWSSDNHDINPVYDMASKLGFFYHLKCFSAKAADSLWSTGTNYTGPFLPHNIAYLYGSSIKSYPIRRLNYANFTTRRSALKPFKTDLLKDLGIIESQYNIYANHLTSFFLECAKNSADHTNGDAFMGMDLIESSDKKSAELHFVFGDLGKGIKQNIQDNLPVPIEVKRAKHWSLYESYYWALKNGNTTKPNNNQNKGLGMSIILELSKSEHMKLSVFDAESRGLLSSLPTTITHEQLRRHFISFTKDRMFYYYGVVKGNAK